MKAMIFAAGLGTRLKPITDSLPKALVPVGGKPLIEHVARKLKASGIDEAVVNVHHFADMMEDWMMGQDIMLMQVSDERDLLLETGGGVLHARKYLESCGHFLIHNVDIISDLDIRWFESQARKDTLATLLVSDRKTSRYLLFDPETMRLVGWTNVSTGEVRSPYPDIDPAACRRLAFSGIHIMSDRVFGIMDTYARERGLDMENPRFPIMDFYLSVCAEYEIYGVEAEELRLVDVGKLDSLEMAEKEISRLCPKIN
ncbi:MAG: NTP transferase domain-containing protein [Bacteroidales bacterium]|nr:NTP transferase domain-containing protein [Bacteroidales bacterium]